MIPNFWKLTLGHRGDLIRLDLVLAILSGIALAILPEGRQLANRFDLILATEVGVVIALLGLVLAGLSILASSLSEQTLAMLDNIGPGLSEDFWPFSFTALLCVLTALTALAFLMVVPNHDCTLIRVSLGVSWSLFFWTLTSTLELIGVVFGYAKIRATGQRRSD